MKLTSEEETSQPADLHDNNHVSQGQLEETQAIEESLRDLNLNIPGPDPELLPEGLLPCEARPNNSSCSIAPFCISAIAVPECSQYDKVAMAMTEVQCDGATWMSSTGFEGHVLQNASTTIRGSQYDEAAQMPTSKSEERVLRNVSGQIANGVPLNGHQGCSQYDAAALTPLATEIHARRQTDSAAQMTSTSRQGCSQYDEAVRTPVATETRTRTRRDHQITSTVQRQLTEREGCSQFDEAARTPAQTTAQLEHETASTVQMSSTGFEGHWTSEGQRQPEQQMSSTGFEGTPAIVNHCDLAALRRAKAKLTVKLRDKTLTLSLRGRLTSMIALINLYLDHQLGLNWITASTLAAKAAGKGDYLARKLRQWVILFMRYGVYPVRRKRIEIDSIPGGEDLDQLIHLHLLELNKAGHVRAQDIVDFLNTPAMKAHLGTDKGFGLRGAQRWMERMGWRYGTPKNGMYKDGHEDSEVVAYRKAFCDRWTNDYSRRMWSYDNNGSKICDLETVNLKDGRYPLILVTHDESTFYANDRRKTRWHHPDTVAPQPKGEGQSIMVSDFLTPEWGRLKHGNELSA